MKWSDTNRYRPGFGRAAIGGCKPVPSQSSSYGLRHRVGWLAGLPVLALLWAGATHVIAPMIADTLSSESAAIVRETGRDAPEPWVRIEIEGRDLLALGETPDAAARAATLKRLAALPGLRRLADGTGLIESVSPFVWTIGHPSPGLIETGGNRPAEIGASALSARLRLVLPPATALRDRTRAARGAPPGFPEAASWLAERLRGLAPGATASLSDSVLSIRGEARDPAAYDMSSGVPPPQGFSLGTIEILPPLVDDFRFVVERRPNGGIVLGGHTVSEAARAEIRAAATSLAQNLESGGTSGAAVEDTMRTARGLDPAIDPAALAKAALRLAGLIREGAVRFESGRLSVLGTALDDEAVGEAETALRDERPAGITAGTVALGVQSASPYTLHIRRGNDGIVVWGYLPDRGSREALRASLKPRFIRDAVLDHSRLSAGAPPQLMAALTTALGPLSTLAKGEIAVSDRSLQLSGESLYAESGRRLGDDLRRAMPPGWETTVAVAARDAAPAYDAPTCARLFSERLTAHMLRFAPGSTELKPDFYPVLDAVAELSKACPGERVEVVGHLDPPGTTPPKTPTLPEAKAAPDKTELKKADKSKKTGKPDLPAEKPAAPSEPEPDLAQARAAAIVDYLLKAGVASEHALAAQGVTPRTDSQGVGLALRS